MNDVHVDALKVVLPRAADANRRIHGPMMDGGGRGRLDVDLDGLRAVVGELESIVEQVLDQLEERTRAKMAEVVKPLMERIRDIVNRTIEAAKVDPKDVCQVLAVGVEATGGYLLLRQDADRLRSERRDANTR